MRGITKFIVGSLTRKGIKETIRPTNMLIDGDNVAAEIDAEFTFSEDVSDFLRGPARKGFSLDKKWGVL